jgi:hypothetical protein
MRGALIGLTGLAAVAAASPALAAACTEQAAQLATRYDLNVAATNTGTRGGSEPVANGGTSTPPTQESRGVGASDTLGAAVGSDSSATSHSTERQNAGSSSGATPLDPAARTSQGGGMAGTPPAAATSPMGTPQISAATRAQAAALLQAARAADADGKEDVCFLRLRELQALVSGGGG